MPARGRCGQVSRLSRVGPKRHAYTGSGFHLESPPLRSIDLATTSRPSNAEPEDILDTAHRLADEDLFPRALATDAARIPPVDLLDRLADADLYGLSGPVWAGGLDAPFLTACRVAEALASGCLTTAFVWMQHLGAVRAAAASDNPAVRELTPSLCTGALRAGLSLGGAVPGPSELGASQTGEGWTFTGTAPFISGWNRIDIVHTAARTDDGRLVWAFLDARETETLAVHRLDLVALDATNTVRAELQAHPVPAERVSSVIPYREGPTPPEVLRMHASLALGVLSRCRRLLGPSPFDEEAARVRDELDRLDPGSIEAARAAAGELAWRAAAALMVSAGARSLLMQNHAQLLARDALFTLVYALRPGSRAAVLARLHSA